MNNETTGYPSMSMAVNKDDLIRQHRKMIDELAAQNERLRSAAIMAKDNSGCVDMKLWDQVDRLLDETPMASLAHVMAETIEDVANIIEKRLEEDDEHPVVMLRGEAERIRQSAKQSGEQQ